MVMMSFTFEIHLSQDCQIQLIPYAFVFLCVYMNMDFFLKGLQDDATFVLCNIMKNCICIFDRKGIIFNSLKWIVKLSFVGSP